MRNPKFEQITPNYRKRVLEVVLREGKRLNRYNLPFAVFTGMKIGSGNRFASITIEAYLAEQGATFVLEDGTRGDFPADFVLHYSDPTYQWSPINRLKRALKTKISDSKLSFRVLADALNTSPTQVVRFLQENRASKQFLQLCKIAQVAGYSIEIKLRKRTAA
ncbi:MAG TPA: hypothetical protein VMG30_12605 [Acidobacteriota bacterium]|nr:hypothetical protein [Acidobacteriota bacterium]